MSRPRVETTLHRLLDVSKSAGLIVSAAKIDGDKIELVFETPRDTLTADLLDWKPTRFPGCEMKVLFRNDSGLMTSIFRFAPGATLTDHEHVGIEQTYLLDGHLVDKEGPAAGLEVKKGEFVWREPGSQAEPARSGFRPGGLSDVWRSTSRRRCCLGGRTDGAGAGWVRPGRGR